jgi:hypothetical protein
MPLFLPERLYGSSTSIRVSAELLMDAARLKSFASNDTPPSSLSTFSPLADFHSSSP